MLSCSPKQISTATCHYCASEALRYDHFASQFNSNYTNYSVHTKYTPGSDCVLHVCVYILERLFFKSSLAFISSCILIHNKLCPKSTSIISYNTEFLVSGPYIDLLEDHLGGGIIQKCD